jgi:hypothetical protein
MIRTTNKNHKIKWFAYAGDKRIPRASTMRGAWGYDAQCSCGWDSRTGGGVLRHVRELVYIHKITAT